MARIGLPVVVALALVAIVAGGRAEAQPIFDSHLEASGSFVAGGTRIDTNDDDIRADLFIISGSSSLLGALTNQAVIEWTFDEPTIACLSEFPGTVLEGTLVPAGSTAVTRVTINPFTGVPGELLFSTFTSGNSCIDATGLASISAKGNFTRGTGLFANATGDFTLVATVTPLVARQEDVRGSRARRRSDPGDLRPSRTFGSVVVTVDGTINLNLNR